MGFNVNTYRLDTQTDLWELFSEAAMNIEAGKSGIFAACASDKEVKSLVLRLHKFRRAYEAQSDEDHKHAFAGLKVIPCLLSGGHEECGINIVVATGNTWSIRVLE